MTYIQLFRRERTSANSGGIRLHDANHTADRLRWNAKPGAYTSNCGRRRSYKGIGSKVEVKHEGVGSFDKHFFFVSEGFVNVNDAVDHEWFQAFSQSL
jgi:hypothetical protein